LKHWKVETMHFYKDKSLYEDVHTANINPMTMTILRSFVLNICTNSALDRNTIW